MGCKASNYVALRLMIYTVTVFYVDSDHIPRNIARPHSMVRNVGDMGNVV